jgi:hypothetical protein
MSQDRILQALQALAEKDHGLEAAVETEALLLREFRRRRAMRGWRRVAAGVVAAGIAGAGLVWMTHSPARQPETTATPTVRSSVTAAPAPPEAVAQTAPVAATREAVPRPVRAVRSGPRETVTEFFPLMDPAPPFDRGQLLRVQLPASAMRSVGLPVSQEQLGEPVQADVLVGEEGMLRAIRFVRFETQ